MWGLVPLLRTRGYSSLPVHFLGKAATFNLLYAFPLLLLGDGDGLVARLAEVFGWAFAFWGVGLYWWAGILYAWQVRKLLATTEPRKASARERDGTGRPDHDPREPGAPLPDRVTMPLLTLVTREAVDEDYVHAARRRAAAGAPDRPRTAPGLRAPRS